MIPVFESQLPGYKSISNEAVGRLDALGVVVAVDEVVPVLERVDDAVLDDVEEEVAIAVFVAEVEDVDDAVAEDVTVAVADEDVLADEEGDVVAADVTVEIADKDVLADEEGDVVAEEDDVALPVCVGNADMVLLLINKLLDGMTFVLGEYIS